MGQKGRNLGTPGPAAGRKGKKVPESPSNRSRVSRRASWGGDIGVMNPPEPGGTGVGGTPSNGDEEECCTCCNIM